MKTKFDCTALNNVDSAEMNHPLFSFKLTKIWRTRGVAVFGGVKTCAAP